MLETFGIWGLLLRVTWLVFMLFCVQFALRFEMARRSVGPGQTFQVSLLPWVRP